MIRTTFVTTHPAPASLLPAGHERRAASSQEAHLLASGRLPGSEGGGRGVLVGTCQRAATDAVDAPLDVVGCEGRNIGVVDGRSARIGCTRPLRDDPVYGPARGGESGCRPRRGDKREGTTVGKDHIHRQLEEGLNAFACSFTADRGFVAPACPGSDSGFRDVGRTWRAVALRINGNGDSGGKRLVGPAHDSL
jgi:hypothetical protein